MADDDYAGDLDGNPALQAVSMRCGVCKTGGSIGVDLLDENGKTIAHGHLDTETAIQFFEMYGEAIDEVLDNEGPKTVN